MKISIILIIIGLIVILIIIVFISKIFEKFAKNAGLNIKDDKITNKPEGVGNEKNKNIINNVANRYGIKRRKPSGKGS